MPNFDYEIHEVYRHCQEEGYDIPTPASIHGAVMVLNALHDISETYERDIYPTEARDIIIDCGPGKDRHIFHCFPDGITIATGVMNGELHAKHILNSEDVVNFIGGLDINRIP